MPKQQESAAVASIMQALDAKDWRSAVARIDEQRSLGTQLKKPLFSRALHLLASGLEDNLKAEDFGERFRSGKALVDHMCEIFPEERNSDSVVALLARLATRAGQLEAAEALLKGVEKLRLRTCLPVLRAYAEVGARAAAERLYEERVGPLYTDEAELEEGLDDQASLWERILAARVDAWRLSSDGCVLALQRVLRDIVALRAWIWRGGPLDESLRSAFGTLGWSVAEASPDDDGRCQASGVQLPRAFGEEQLNEVAEELDRLIALECEKKPEKAVSIETFWLEFKQQLAALGQYDVVVDGANVGYHMQNFDGGCFQHRAIEAVRALHEKAGDRVLIVLRKRWTCRETAQIEPNSKRRKSVENPVRAGQEVQAEDQGDLDETVGGSKRRTEVELAKQWRENGSLFISPPVINDDNVAMYVAVAMCRLGSRVQLVTNDFFRDHKVNFSRPLRRWLDRHVSRYALKYVNAEHVDEYQKEEEEDVVNGAIVVSEVLVWPGEGEGTNTFQKVRLFPPLSYMAPANASACGRCWHFPLGNDWVYPRRKREDLNSMTEARARFERRLPTFLVCWDASTFQ